MTDLASDVPSYSAPYLGSEDAKALIEYEKLRYEYAWRWFDFHGRQRQVILNFFLIANAFVFGACVNSAVAEKGHLLAIICLFGIVISFLFWGMDRRNQELLSHGRAILLEIERHVLFRSDVMVLPDKHGGRCRGVFEFEATYEGSLLKHRFLMPAVYVSVGCAYVALLAVTLR